MKSTESISPLSLDATSPITVPSTASGTHNILERRDREDHAYGEKVEKSQINVDMQEASSPVSEAAHKPSPDTLVSAMEWSKSKKLLTTMLYSTVTFCVTFSSSVFSNTTETIAEDLGASRGKVLLETSLFVLVSHLTYVVSVADDWKGFGIGPTIWGPLSELYGRKRPILIGFAIFAILQIPIAIAPRLNTIITARFFAGAFGSAPLAVIGGALADIWSPAERGFALGLFSGATFTGAVVGPIIGVYLSESYLGWRWSAWMTLCMAGLSGVLATLFCAESYPPILNLREAPMDMHCELHGKIIIDRYLLRPWKMLLREPILILMTLYIALIYGLIYLFFEVYPIAFSERGNWGPVTKTLPFLGILLGVVCGVLLIVYYSQRGFFDSAAGSPRSTSPERRLLPMIIGALILPVGLFWFAWTSDPHISWIPQVLAGIPIGCGVITIFTQGLLYIIDVYGLYANSALAINVLLRSLAGGGFPLFAATMYRSFGVPMATTLLGCLSVVFLPAPICLYFYGRQIRGWSKYDVAGDHTSSVGSTTPTCVSSKV